MTEKHSLIISLVSSGEKRSAKEVNPEIEYDPEELKKGIEVELEHTNYRAIATIIAKHHLAEDPEYYTLREHNPLYQRA